MQQIFETRKPLKINGVILAQNQVMQQRREAGSGASLIFRT